MYIKKLLKKSGWLTISVVVIAIVSYLVYHYGYYVYQDYDYYTYYDNINGLQRSSPIYINGVRVGEISDIDIDVKEKVKVTMSINKKTKIPRGSIALLASKGLLGERMILLETSDSSIYYTHKDLIKGRYDTSVMEMSDQINPIIESAKYILETADKNFVNFNQKLDNGLVKQTQKDVKRMEQSMSKYESIVKDIRINSDKVVQSLRNMNKSVTKSAKNKDSLNVSLLNAEKSTESISKAPIVEQTASLRNSVNEVNKQTNDVLASEAVNEALNNKEQYKNASDKLQDINKNLKETKEHPKGISLIGGD